MTIGTVKFFNDSKGYGFIQPEDGGKDAFVHISSVERAGMRSLQQDQRLSYDLEEGKGGKTSAINLQLEEPAAQAGQSADAPEAVQQQQPETAGN